MPPTRTLGAVSENERRAPLLVKLRIELPVFDDACGVVLHVYASAGVFDYGVIGLAALQGQRQPALIAALHRHAKSGVSRNTRLGRQRTDRVGGPVG
jgi:hypothetical protein